MHTGDRGNSAGYSNAAVDGLLSAASTETNPDKRAGFRRAQKQVNADAPWIFLWVPQDIYGVSKRLKGWQPSWVAHQPRLHRVEAFPVSFSAFAGRLLHLVPVLLGVSLIAFLMLAATPGDPVDIMLGEQQASVAQLSPAHDMGLDLPLPQRFGHFLKGAVSGDFGTSYFHRRPVAEVIAERLPATIELTLVSLVVALVVAIPLGVLAAVKKDGWLDRAATVTSLLGVSLPGFWFGLLLILFFGVTLHVLPVSGARRWPSASHR